MKIRILPRNFFERIQGTEKEKILLTKNKIISINSSWGDDSVPPFSQCNRNHRNLLCLTFDDVCNEPDPDDHDKCILFSEQQTEKIMRFVDDGAMPLLIHCTAGISRSGAVGKVLDWYFNRYVANHPEDHKDFVENNRQIMPNSLVEQTMIRFLRHDCQKS